MAPSVTETLIAELIALAAQLFPIIWGIFNPPNPTTPPVPPTAAPTVIAALHSAPGLTDAHKAVITGVVNAVASATKPTTILSIAGGKAFDPLLPT